MGASLLVATCISWQVRGPSWILQPSAHSRTWVHCHHHTPGPCEHLYLVAVLLVGEGGLLPLPPGADGLVVVVTLLLCPRPLLLLLVGY